MSRLIETGVVIVLFILAINVVFLNIYFFSHPYPQTAAATSSASQAVENKSACDEICQQWIVQKVQQQIPTPASIVDKQENSKAVAKEYVIPLGSGSTKSKDWMEIPGVEATIDTKNYPPIKSVTLEMYLSIPTANGEVFAKLFNVTDKHDVWFSEVSMEADKVVKKSVSIKLEQGNRLYRVMMKSTLGYEALLQNAKLRILTE